MSLDEDTQRREMVFVGRLVDNPDLAYQAIEMVAPEHIRTPDVRKVYTAIVSLASETSRVTPIMIADRVTTLTGVDDVLTYLLSLADLARFEDPFEVVAGQIREAATWASMDAINRYAPKVAQSIRQAGGDPQEAVAALIERLTSSLPSGRDKASALLVDLMAEAAKELDQTNAAGGAMEVVTTGIDDLDALIGGFVPGELVIIAGSSGFGKTTIGTQIAYHVAHSLPVEMYQLEMGGKAAAKRTLAGLAEIPARLMRGGYANVDEIERAYQAVQTAKDAIRSNFVMRWPRNCKVSQVRTAALARKSRDGRIGLIVVDHSKLIRVGGKVDADVIARMAAAFEQLKDLAKEVEAPVVVLAQLTREGLKRRFNAKRIRDLRPRREDIYGGGDPIEFADLVLLGHRPAEAWKECEPPTRDEEAHAEWHRQLDYWSDKGEVIVDKFRGGREGQSVTLRWNGARSRFEDIPVMEPEF